jgi:type VI secretion system protein ImpE
MATAEELIAQGDPAGALQALQQQVRAKAADPQLRVFLFQLLCVLGQWQRAHDQLKVCGELDAGTLAMVNTYGAALQCEVARDAVFAGRHLPHVFGPPAAWVALLAQALQLDAQGHSAEAAALRSQALEQAPASAGTAQVHAGSTDSAGSKDSADMPANEQAFNWIADADSRLGPVLEVIINGRYGWVPFMHLHEVTIEPVTDLRDLVWAPAHLEFTNGGDTVALLPVRYPGAVTGVATGVGTGVATDAALQMSRKTEWLEMPHGQFSGCGQRVLATDAAEFGLLELRRLTLTPQAQLEPGTPG